MSITEKLVRADKVALSWPELDPETRENCVREDLARRLKSVCDDLSSVDFEALILQMTREQLRGERVITRNFSHS